MNQIRRICRSLFSLSRRAGLQIASAALVVSWPDPPLPAGRGKHPLLPAGPQPAVRFLPGWNKHPPLPAHAHTVVIGGPPGWHTTLIVVMAAVLAAAVVVVLTRRGQPHAAPQSPRRNHRRGTSPGVQPRLRLGRALNPHGYAGNPGPQGLRQWQADRRPPR